MQDEQGRLRLAGFLTGAMIVKNKVIRRLCWLDLGPVVKCSFTLPSYKGSHSSSIFGDAGSLSKQTLSRRA